MVEPHDILMEFGQCARKLIEVLYQDKGLNTTEQMFIENHLALIRTAFEGWKRRNPS